MVNMTPLIDVVFLIIIFFIVIMSFSEVLPTMVTLPNADEAKENRQLAQLTITVKSENLLFVGSKRVPLISLEEVLRLKVSDPKGCTVQFRGDENVPYDIVQKVLQKIAAAGITNINFSTRMPYKKGFER